MNRKKITLAIIVIIISAAFSTYAQDYSMDNTPVSACTGNFFDSGGNTANYLNSENYTKTFTSDNGNRISFNFQTFALYNDGYDYLEIYDGTSNQYPLIGRYYSTNSPGIVTSSGTSLTFVFYSNSSYASTGWSAIISCTTAPLDDYPMTSGTTTACTGIFSDNGGLAANYPHNENREMTFCSGTSDYIIFEFTHFSMYTDDTLYAFDGANSSSPLIGVYTGTNLPEKIYSKSGSCVTFKFKSNSVNSSSGWRALISCSATAPSLVYNFQDGIRYTCGGVFNDNGGDAGNYTNSLYKTMTFTSDNGNRISFNFQTFALYNDGYDYLEIYDGESSQYPLIGKYYYNNSPGVVTSSGISLTFVFYSNSSYASTGWSANISCTTAPLADYTMTSGTVTDCSGIFSDNGGLASNYPNNENREMTFCSGTSEYVVFDFTHFSISSDDTLYAYDGATSSSPLIGAYTSTTLPETIYSKSGTCVTFKFKSNSANVSSGWRALISCSSTAPVQEFNMQDGKRYTCGGTFYDAGGSTSSYSSGLAKTMTFYSDNGNRIQIDFTSFLLYNDGYDYLEIYDGPSTAYPVTGRYYGSNSPGTVTSSGTSLTFYFYSNSSYSSSGWAANISCTTSPLADYPMTSGTVNACSGIFSDNGGVAANYPNNENREMTFCSGTSDYIVFDFTHFSISSDDTLYAYDGTNSSSPLIGAYTGTSLPEQIYSKSGTCVTFKFKSNSANVSSGWRALISCSATAPVQEFNMQDGKRYTCGGTFYDAGGSTSSYSNGLAKTMTFYSDNGNRIQIDFTLFSLYSDGYDYLEIYDGPSTAYPVTGRYYGSNSPGTVTSSGTSLTFYFYSNSSYGSSGWSANISCTTSPLADYPMTSGTVNACSGIFSDNGGVAANYPNNENREMTFCSGTSDYIVFDFTHFSISSDDTLYAYDGATSSSPLIGAYTGTSLPEPIYSKTGSCVTFKFISNTANVSSGWRAIVSCSASAPVQNFIMQPGIRYTCGGTFYDDGGPSLSYSNNQSKTMTFYSDNGNRIRFDFQSFTTESGYDKLYVYDGPSSAFPLLNVYSGSAFPGIITSTGTSLTFVFSSDGSATYSGWTANISCTTPPLTYYNMSSGTDSACEGVFFDNGGPNQNYPHNENRVHTFCSDNNEFIIFDFTHFSLSTDDTLFVYDGNNTSAQLVGKYYGTSLPEKIYSKSGSCLTFQFVSNNVNSMSGWRALISCDSIAPIQEFNIQSGVRYTCGGTFYDDGGPYVNYNHSQSRTMTFYSDNGNRINFDFQSFTTESGYDKLYVYDGPSSSFPIIGTYSGSTFPGIITSTGTSLTFVFSSDGSNAYAGWMANISCSTPPLPVYNLSTGVINTCEGVFYDDGGSHASYSNNFNQLQTFCSDSGNFIKFTFTQNNFNIVDGDSLFVYDGSNTDSPLAIFTGYYSPGSITSITGNCLTFKFVSNSSSNASGWQAIISCVDTVSTVPVINMSSGAVYTCSGKFYDAGGASGNYSNSESKITTIYSNSGCPVSVSFNSFTTESGYDKLYIYDGPSTLSALVATYSGSSIPASVTSTGNCLTFKFTSDGSTNYAGWSADISCEKAGITATPSLTACNGDTITLTATSGTAYLWSNGETTQTINVTSGGIYSVSVTSVIGCNLVSDPKVVTFYSLPSSTINAGGATTFCQGNSVNLSLSGGSTYLWNTNATSSAINISSGGDYWATITNASGCSASTDTVSVTVLSLPLNTISVNGNTSLCQGESTILTADDGVAWIWNNTETTQSITVNQSGNYSATITGVNGCESQSQQININVYDFPGSVITIVGDTAFCDGQSVQLTASSGNTYLWSSGQTTQSITANQAGMYTVTVTNMGICSTVSDAVNITVFQNPAEPTITQSVDTLFATQGFVQYDWYYESAFIQSTANNYFVAVNSGFYSVVVLDSSGCSSASQSYFYQNIGYDELNTDYLIDIYPNPNNGKFVVKSTSGSDFSITIFNVESQILYQTGKDLNSELNIDISSSPKGIYIIKISDDINTHFSKLIIE